MEFFITYWYKNDEEEVIFETKTITEEEAIKIMETEYNKKKSMKDVLEGLVSVKSVAHQ